MVCQRRIPTVGIRGYDVEAKPAVGGCLEKQEEGCANYAHCEQEQTECVQRVTLVCIGSGRVARGSANGLEQTEDASKRRSEERGFGKEGEGEQGPSKNRVVFA
jgi:hypothetical protein